MRKASIEIDITRECNIQCKNCIRFSNIFNDNPKSRISIYEFTSIFKQLLKNFWLTDCIIIGGEPTLHPNFKELCILAKAFMSSYKHNNIFLCTNFTNKTLLDWFISTISNKILFFDVYKEILGKNIDFKQFIVDNFHLNLYCIKTIKNIDINKIKKYCHEFNKNNIPFYIYKFNNIVRYAHCWNSVFISRLLQREHQFTFENMDDLLNVDETYFINNICKYCAVASYIMKNTITNPMFNIYDITSSYVDLFKGDKYIGNHMNDDFILGYKYMLEHQEFYK